MSSSDMPIFTRMFDFLTWFLPVTNGFPTTQRHAFTKRLLDSAFDLYECLERANHARGGDRKTALNDADYALDRLRMYLRLAERWKWLSSGQYEHVARMVTEIGRLLGGWHKASG